MRSLTLEYISRVAISDIPKESIQSLLALCVETLQSSHEEDGALAQEIITDIFKAYKSLEDLSTPYLEWLVQLFDSIPAAAAKYIVGSGKKSKVEEPIQASCSIKLSQDIAISTFRLGDLSVGALPLASPERAGAHIMLHVRTLFSGFLAVSGIPQETHCIRSRVGPQDGCECVAGRPCSFRGRREGLAPLCGSETRSSEDTRLSCHSEQESDCTFLFLNLPARPDGTSERYSHLPCAPLAFQAKPMVEQHQQAICDALLSIMKTSLSNLSLRKEILNALRTLLTSEELNKGLLPKIEELLDMDCLIGTDRAVGESLKQVAFIHLTELLLLVKQDIKVEYIQTVVNMAIASLMDVAAPLTLQVTSVRVLYNIVVDIVFPRRAESEQFRDILSSILECMLTKLDCMCVEIPRILSISKDLETLHKKRKEEKKDSETAKGAEEANDNPEIKNEDGMDIDQPAVDDVEAGADAQGATDSSRPASLQHCFKTVCSLRSQSLII